MSLDYAQQKARIEDYIEERPHSAIGNKRPIELIDRSRHTARPHRSILEKLRQGGPRWGAAQIEAEPSLSPAENCGVRQTVQFRISRNPRHLGL
jgi:hypothetical protein